MKQEEITKFKADDYGDVLAFVNTLELVSFEDDGGYQGTYMAILTDGERLFYYFGYYGSCSGCDWLEDVRDWKTGEVDYKEAVNYCADMKPKFIVPKDKPLNVKINDEHSGFTVDGIKINLDLVNKVNETNKDGEEENRFFKYSRE
jgi:hypothetical protein